MLSPTVAPLLTAVAVALTVTAVHRRLPPVTATRATTIALVVVTMAAVPTLWIASLGYLAHAPLLGRGLAWCIQGLGVHDRVPVAIGLPGLVLVAVGTLRAWRVVRSHRRLRLDQHGSIEVAHDDRAFAFTLPGRGGRVVWSSGLVELLDDRERSVVLAHERAHARYRHDRYLLIAQLTSAAVPMLRPLSSRLRFSLERWADEASADECGDRRFVAHTLGKVALYNVAPVGVLSFGGLGVSARVAGLLAPPTQTPRASLLIALWLAIAAVGALAAFQIHHLATLAAALCSG